MDRPKRPPPLPKFEEKKDKKELEEKLNSFISSLQPAEPAPEVVQDESKKDPLKSKVVDVKKKISLANLNSKLNNMLSAKKINISTALTIDP